MPPIHPEAKPGGGGAEENSELLTPHSSFVFCYPRPHERKFDDTGATREWRVATSAAPLEKRVEASTIPVPLFALSSVRC